MLRWHQRSWPHDVTRFPGYSFDRTLHSCKHRQQIQARASALHLRGPEPNQVREPSRPANPFPTYSRGHPLSRASRGLEAPMSPHDLEMLSMRIRMRNAFMFSKKAASKYAEPWRSAALWLPDDTYIPPDRVRYWAKPVAWPHWNGKITLGGDAAHPMMPFRAQGLNNALADADQYVMNLVAIRDGQKSLGDALTEYGKRCWRGVRRRYNNLPLGARCFMIGTRSYSRH